MINDYLIKVINSCKTPNQLYATRTWVHLIYKRSLKEKDVVIDIDKVASALMQKEVDFEI